MACASVFNLSSKEIFPASFVPSRNRPSLLERLFSTWNDKIQGHVPGVYYVAPLSVPFLKKHLFFFTEVCGGIHSSGTLIVNSTYTLIGLWCLRSSMIGSEACIIYMHLHFAREWIHVHLPVCANITCDGTKSWNHSSASSEGIQHLTVDLHIHALASWTLSISNQDLHVGCLEQEINQNHAEVFFNQEETETEASFAETWSSSRVSSQDLQNYGETNSDLTSEEEDDPTRWPRIRCWERSTKSVVSSTLCWLCRDSQM